MAGIYGIGVQALNAAQLSLLTAQHNIANVNNPGFRRQQVVQSTNFALPSSAGYVGQGAQVETIRRLYNNLLDEQVLGASSQSEFYNAYYCTIKQIDNILADPNAGLSPAIQEFFKGVNAVADVVDIALDRGDDDLAPGPGLPAALDQGLLLGLDVGQQMGRRTCRGRGRHRGSLLSRPSSRR